MEYVLVQSATKTVADPAFRAVVNQSIAKLESFPKVTKLRSPLAKGNEGQISKDGHAVLIQFSPKGSYDETTTYIDTIVAGTKQVQKANPDFYVGEAGSSSTGKALDKMFGSQLARAGNDLDPDHADHPAARVRLARGSLDPARAGAHLRVRDHGACRSSEPHRADGPVGLPR